MTPQWFYKLETNISSIQVASTKQILSFWPKILETHVSEPLRFCYEALGKNDDQKTKTWTWELRKLLNNLFFGKLWESQDSAKVRNNFKYIRRKHTLWARLILNSNNYPSIYPSEPQTSTKQTH